MPSRAVFLALTSGGAAWALHLFAGYFLVSLGCARGWTRLAGMLGLVTAVCAAAAGAAALMAWRRRPLRSAGDEGEALRLALGVGAFLAALFAIMILLGGLTVVALPVCQEAVGGSGPVSQGTGHGMHATPS